MKVIIADDDEALSHLLKITLQVSFYAMAKDLATKGEQLTESLDVEQFTNLKKVLLFLDQTEKLVDLIFVEINTPGMDGYTFLEICQQKFRNKYRELIVVTDRGDKQDVKRGIMAGATDYILKPYEPEDMMKHVFGVWKKVEGEGKA